MNALVFFKASQVAAQPYKQLNLFYYRPNQSNHPGFNPAGLKTLRYLIMLALVALLATPTLWGHNIPVGGGLSFPTNWFTGSEHKSLCQISGQVISNHPRVPLGPTTVTLLNQHNGLTIGEIILDHQGKFAFGPVPPGQYGLFISSANGGTTLLPDLVLTQGWLHLGVIPVISNPGALGAPTNPCAQPAGK